jgi:hypothetical protein
VISVQDDDRTGQSGELWRFRQDFYDCLTSRPDALFELTDAMLCADGPVTSLAKSEHRRGHGALRDGVNEGRADIDRFRDVVARQQVPRCDDDRIVLAIDVSNWLHALFHSEAGETVGGVPTGGGESLRHRRGAAWPTPLDREDSDHINAINEVLDFSFANRARRQAQLTHDRLL